MLLYRTIHFFSPTPTPLTKDYKPRHMRSPTDHDIKTKKTLKKQQQQTKSYKAPGIDNLASDVMILGGDESVKQRTKKKKRKKKKEKDQIIETKKIPVDWKEAKMIILHKKGDTNNIDTYRPINLHCHM